MSLLAELRRRKVHRAAAFYAAGAWLLVQIAATVFPYFDLPAWSVRLVIVTLLIGFPVALVVSWFYTWTAHGWQLEDAIVAPAALPPAAKPARENSIAVLPFADLSAGRDQEYFSDGLAEELLNLLAQLQQLQVTARTSSFAFRGKAADIATIARVLGVAHVLEGSVRKSGNRLRVTAQLIRAADSSHVWSQTYEREITDVFAMQDEIAGAVVAALRVRLLPDQHVTNPHRTANTQAYEQFLLGQNVFRRGRYDDFRHALAAFRRALELDPRYAPALAAAASALSSVADYAATPAEREAGKLEALATAQRSIELAPGLADGYVARGHLRYRQLWDWRGSEQDFQRALALEPNRSEVLFGYALALYNLRRPAEAVTLLERATKSDPLSWTAWTLYGALLREGDAAAARAALKRAVEISPEASFPRFLLGTIDLDAGDHDAARSHFLQAGAGYREAGLAMLEHSLGHAADSQRALDELEARYAAGFSYQIAEVHAWRGDADAAFAWLDRACAQRDSGIPRLRADQSLRGLHGDPRYAALVRRLGFPD